MLVGRDIEGFVRLVEAAASLGRTMSAATVLEVRRAGLKAIFLTNRGFP